MIPVQLAPEPPSFDDDVRQPGRRAVLEMIGCADHLPPRRGRPRAVVASSVLDLTSSDLERADFWREALDDLRRAYSGICAYLGMRIHPSTGAASVDHFLPKSKFQCLAYEWSNFRFSSSRVNTLKGEQLVLDPCQIGRGWFVLNLGSFEVEPAAQCRQGLKDRIQDTIDDLGLNEETFVKSREEYHDLYHGLRGEPAYPLEWLRRECPFVAEELERQGRLKSEDTPEPMFYSSWF